MSKITRIQPEIRTFPAKKKVAAYARVSKDTERLMHSVSAQISYYSDLIQKNPGWEYAGVYADSGITGTSVSGRREFVRLLEDCEAGKIDIVLCKSISRFARNTVDLLNTVRRLRELGVEVRFEKENINSISGDGELMLSILASFAQEESRSISENVKWGIHKRFRNGEIGAANKHFLGYRYDDVKKQYVIIPEEAEVVRWMFQMYIDGLSLQAICDELNASGCRTVKGCLFQESSLAQLLKNEIYAGDLRRQKSYMDDPITKNKVKNHGELPQYYMRDCHEAILDRDTWERVLAEQERRTALLNPTYPFTKKIVCGICGGTFTRKKSKVKGRIFYHWICRSKKDPGKTCTSRNYSESELERISAGILGDGSFDAEHFESQVKKMVVLEDGSIEFLLTGNETKIWKDLHIADTRHTHTLTESFNGKVLCGKCGKPYHRVNSGGRWVYWYCIGKRRKGQVCDSPNFTDYALRQIAAQMMELDAFDEEAFSENVALIRVLSKDKLEFNFADGRTALWERM